MRFFLLVLITLLPRCTVGQTLQHPDCVLLEIEECNNNKYCTYDSQKNLFKHCKPTERKFDVDCNRHRNKNSCINGDHILGLCMWDSGCYHKCDVRGWKKCRSVKFREKHLCTPTRTRNPCFACKPASICNIPQKELI